MDLYLAASAQERPAPEASCRYLCFSWAAWDSLTKGGFAADAWEDCLPKNLVPETQHKIQFLARHWHKDQGRDLTIFEGISLGESLTFSTWISDFQPALRFLVALQEELRQHAPLIVYCELSVPELFRSVLDEVQKQRGGFRVEWVEQRGVIGSTSRWEPAMLSAPLPKLLAYRLVDWLSSCVQQLKPRRGPVLWMSYYPSLDSALGLIVRATPSFRLVLADLPGRRRLKSLLSTASRILWPAHSRPAFSRAQKEALTALRRDWKEAQEAASFRAQFDFREVNLWPIFAPRLNARIDAQFEPLAWTASELKSAWTKAPPAVVLLPTDASPLQGLLVSLARLSDVPSVLVAHGLPMDYHHPLSDTTTSHYVVWGPEQKRLHMLLNTEARQVVEVLGNPYFDRYAVPNASGAPARIKKVLVLSSGLDEFSMLASSSDPERYATTVVPAILSVPGWDVTLKLHPSESLEYYQGLLADHKGKFDLVRDRPIVPCLREADLIVGPMTTVIMEAMLLGKPVLCVNLTRKTYPPPFDTEWGIAPVTTLKELEGALEAIREKPAEFIRAEVSRYPRILERFAGPTDGAATERLLTFLHQVAVKPPAGVKSRL